MDLRFSLALTPRGVKIAGVGSLVLMAGVLALSFVMGGTLEPEEATHHIRLFLERDLMQRHMAELRAGNLKTPDPAMGQRWTDDYRALANATVSAVEIRGSLVNIPFVTDRVFIAKAILRDEHGAEQTRYFRLRTGGRFIGVLWTTESSIWAWRLAI